MICFENVIFSNFISFPGRTILGCGLFFSTNMTESKIPIDRKSTAILIIIILFLFYCIHNISFYILLPLQEIDTDFKLSNELGLEVYDGA